MTGGASCSSFARDVLSLLHPSISKVVSIGHNHHNHGLNAGTMARSIQSSFAIALGAGLAIE